VLFRSIPVAEGKSTNQQELSPKTFEMETLGSEGIKPSRYKGIYRLDAPGRHERPGTIIKLAPDGQVGLRIFFQPLRAASAAIFDRSRSFARADPAGGYRCRTAGFGCLSHPSGA
jgi:hypothetical protein